MAAIKTTTTTTAAVAAAAPAIAAEWQIHHQSFPSFSHSLTRTHNSSGLHNHFFFRLK